jgi:hypothetical protein
MAKAFVLDKSPSYRARPELVGKVAIVTGASSGIGAAAARKLAAEGLKAVLVARREDRLTRLADEIRGAGGEALVIPADIAVEADRRRIYQTVRASYGGADVLINNAGFGWYGYGSDMPWELAEQMIKVNTEAMVHLTLLYLPEMRRRGYGHIINVGSIAGGMPNQGIMLYSATKAFEDAFTTSLFRELRGGNVHVSIVRPGPVSTEFYATARERPAGLRIPAERFAVSPERVVGRIWSLLKRPRRVAFVPRILWFTLWVEPYFGWIIDRLGPLLLRRQLKPH